MKISVVSSILGDYSLDESLKYLSGLGVDEFELGVGGYPGKAHADALVLSKDKRAREELLETFRKYNMGISALAVHRKRVHPDRATAEKFEADFEAALRSGGADRRGQARHVFRLSRFRSRRQGAVLDHLRLAARLSQGAGMAVEGSAHSLLEKSREVCGGQRREENRSRIASRILRV